MTGHAYGECGTLDLRRDHKGILYLVGNRRFRNRKAAITYGAKTMNKCESCRDRREWIAAQVSAVL